MSINRGRVFLGGLAGSVVWILWHWIVRHLIVGLARYQAAQDSGFVLPSARYPFFREQWFVITFVMALILAYLYAAARQTLGAKPTTALRIGILVGFLAAFPLNFQQATWAPIDRMVPLGSVLDMWGGCILATLVAAWLYKPGKNTEDAKQTV
jgi:hypothetical protein